MSDEPSTKEQQRQERLARRRSRKRARILQAAREVLEERGVDAFSLDAVADKLALTSASLYHYFAGKGDLLFELAAELATEDSAAFIEAIEQADGGPDAVVTLIRRFRSHYQKHLDRLVLVLTVVASGVDTPVRKQRMGAIAEGVVSALVERLDESRERGQLLDGVSPRTAAQSALIHCCGVAITLHRFHYRGASATFDTGELVDELCHTVYRGLCGRSEPGSTPTS